MPFSRVLYIEQDDFREDPPKKFFRLGPGREVRLRYAYIIKCTGVVKDPQTGEITELRCTYDPETKSGSSQAGRKVKGTIHWVSAEHALEAEVRLYDHLFSKPDPDDVPEGKDWRANLNPNSLEVLTGCKLEPSLAAAQARRPRPVRAQRLLLCRRHRQPARQARLQPHRHAQGHLGQDREGRRKIKAPSRRRVPSKSPALRDAAATGFGGEEIGRAGLPDEDRQRHNHCRLRIGDVVGQRCRGGDERSARELSVLIRARRQLDSRRQFIIGPDAAVWINRIA